MAAQSDPKLTSAHKVRRGNRRGASAVEFALVGSILFLVIFGTIELGRAIFVKQSVEKAAREGCRVAVLEGTTTSEIEAAVQSYLRLSGVNVSTVTVSPDPPSSADIWAPVTVRVNVSYANASWLPLPRYLANASLSGSCTLPREAGQE